MKLNTKELMMNAAVDVNVDSSRAARYARCVKMSKKNEWQIDREQAQSVADAAYFRQSVGRHVSAEEASQMEGTVLAAYRWQYIISGVQHPHFGRLLAGMTTQAQMTRIQRALGPILATP